MIVIILKLIFYTVCLVWGVKIITEPGMALERIGEWAEDKVKDGHKIYDVLLTCPYCMPSLYSAFGYGIGYLLGVVTKWEQLYAYPIVVCGSSLVMGIIWIVFLAIVQIKKYYEILNRETD